VLTIGTDLLEPIRIVVQEVQLPVILMTPVPAPATSLIRIIGRANIRHIVPYLGPCQFPNPIIIPGKPEIRKPADW
jgi:hypothetical protein